MDVTILKIEPKNLFLINQFTSILIKRLCLRRHGIQAIKSNDEPRYHKQTDDC